MKSLYFVLICLIVISDNANSSNAEHLPKTQKEPIIEGEGPRKLAGDDNYIIIYFNQEVTYEKYQDEYKNNISKIMIDDAEQDLTSQFTIPLNKGLKVYFEGIINSFGYFFNGDDDDNAQFISSIDFSHFDWSKFDDMTLLFAKCYALTSIDFSNFDLSKVTDMRYMFYCCTSLKSVILPENLQNVVDMSYMFNFCYSLKSIDFSKIDLSKVTDMDKMFQYCISLESVILPEKLQNVIDMNYMFFDCHSLKSIDLSKSDLSNVINMDSMFFNCTSLESVTLPESLTNVKDMDLMFYRCSSLKSIDLSNISLTKVTGMQSMFSHCKSLESVIFPKSSPENIEDMNSLMRSCTSLTSIDLSMFTLSENTTIKGLIEGCDSLVAIDLPIFDFETYQFVINLKIDPGDLHLKYLSLKWFSGESSDFAKLLSQLSDLYGLNSFSVCTIDKEIIQSIQTQFNKQKKEVELEFCCNYTECRLTKDPNYILVNFNKKCTYVNGFKNNYRPNIYSIVLDGVEREKNEQLDVKKGSKMKIHFTAPLTDFSNFFSSQYDTNVKNIISMDFSNFNSSLIDKFSSSFKGCTSLQSFDFSSFTISSETDISNMFEDCSSLAAINLSNFDLTNNEINNIFKNLGQIRYLNLLNYLGETKDIYTFLNNLRDLSKSQRFICLDESQFNDVDSYYKESNNGESIENEFEICCNFDFEDYKCGYLLVSFITESTYENGFENEYRANIDKIILNGVEKTKNEALEIPAGSKMKIYFSSVPSSFKEFFSADNDNNTVNIDSIDFSHMDLSEVTDMSYLFDGCTSLESVTFPKNTPKAINNIQDIFSGCSTIKSIDLSNFIIPAEAKFTSMFSGCKKLIAIDLPKISTFTGETLISLFDDDETPPLKYMGWTPSHR